MEAPATNVDPQVIHQAVATDKHLVADAADIGLLPSVLPLVLGDVADKVAGVRTEAASVLAPLRLADSSVTGSYWPRGKSAPATAKVGLLSSGVGGCLFLLCWEKHHHIKDIVFK